MRMRSLWKQVTVSSLVGVPRHKGEAWRGALRYSPLRHGTLNGGAAQTGPTVVSLA